MGEKLVFELGIENLGSEPIDGARIHTRGKWNDDTVRNVMAGTFKEDFYFEGSNLHTSLEFLPGEPLYVNLVTYPKKEKKKKTGTYTFTFTPNWG